MPSIQQVMDFHVNVDVITMFVHNVKNDGGFPIKDNNKFISSNNDNFINHNDNKYK
jgi:hypothetical protein